ncbi:helix-turn-helix transcriptional regulator [Erwinia aphidicola]|uniref:helix-turn-helix transcriptional regulator n=1 Tax=Erwinia aphidicola TaxID=68334 RepID=UPI0030CE6479
MFNGSNLRLARLYHELSLEQVAERVGKTRQYIQRLESGYAAPTKELAIELASVLGVVTAFLSLKNSLLYMKILFTSVSALLQGRLQN